MTARTAFATNFAPVEARTEAQTNGYPERLNSEDTNTRVWNAQEVPPFLLTATKCAVIIHHAQII